MFKTYMYDALEEAAKALERGEVPVGAVIVEKSGNIIARAGNEHGRDWIHLHMQKF